MISSYTVASSSSSSSSSTSSFKRPRIGSEGASLDTTSTIALPILGIPREDDSPELRLKWRSILEKHKERSLAHQMTLLASDELDEVFVSKKEFNSSSSSSSSRNSLIFTRLPMMLQQTIFSFASDFQAMRLVSRSWRWMIDDMTINEVVMPLIQSIDYLHRALSTPDVQEARAKLELIVKCTIKNFRKESWLMYKNEQQKMIPNLKPPQHSFQLCHCYKVHSTSMWWTQIREQIKCVFVSRIQIEDYSRLVPEYPPLLQHSDDALVKFMLSMLPTALPLVDRLANDFEFLKSLALYNGLRIQDLPPAIQAHADFIEQIARPAVCHFADNLQQLQNRDLTLDKEDILAILNNKLLAWGLGEITGIRDFSELLRLHPSLYEFYPLRDFPKLIAFIFEHDYHHYSFSDLIKDPSFIGEAVKHPEGAHILQFADSFADHLEFYQTACLSSHSFLKKIVEQWLNPATGRFGSPTVHAALRANPEIMLRIAQLMGLAVFQLNPALITDFKIVVAAAKHCNSFDPHDARGQPNPNYSRYSVYRDQVVKILESHQDNILLMVKILKKNGFFIKHIKSELQIRPEIILAAVPTFPEAVRYCTDDFLEKLEVSPKIRSDLQAIKADLEELSFKEKITPKICLHYQAARINPEVLPFMDKSLQRTKEIIAQIVSQCGTMLECVVKEFRSDPDIVLMAVQNDIMAIEFAEGEARSHFQVLLEVVSADGSQGYDYIKSMLSRLTPQQRNILLRLATISNNLNNRLYLDEIESDLDEVEGDSEEDEDDEVEGDGEGDEELALV